MKKKIYLFIFALLTVLAYNPVSAADLAGIISNPNDVGMVMYTKSSFSGDVVMTVLNDTPVTVISKQVEGEGYRWVQVRTKDGYEGWVFATGIVDSNGKPLLPSFVSTSASTSSSSSAPKTTYPYSYSYSGSKNSSTKSTSGVTNYYGNSNTGSGNNVSFGSKMVWIYPTGKKYHSHAGCSGDNDWQVTIEQALNLGLEPCKKCF